jgi:hypothetical protein
VPEKGLLGLANIGPISIGGVLKILDLQEALRGSPPLAEDPGTSTANKRLEEGKP